VTARLNGPQAIRWGAAALVILGSLASAPVLGQTAPAKPAAAQPVTFSQADELTRRLRETFVTPQSTRRIAVEELGFPEGISLSGLGGARDVFFPIDSALQVNSAKLELQIAHYRSPDARASVQISINDRPLWARPLGEGDGAQTLSVDVPNLDLAQNPFVKMTLRYAAALSENRCFDERSLDDFLRIDPRSILAVSYDPRTITNVRTARALLPRDVTITLPAARLAPDQYSTAMFLGSTLTSEGKRVTYERMPAVGGSIRLDSAANQQAAVLARQILGLAGLPAAAGGTFEIATDKHLAAWFVAAEILPVTAGIPTHVGEIAILSAADMDMLGKAIASLSAAIGQAAGATGANVKAALDAAIPQPVAGMGEGATVSLWRFGARPVIAILGPNSDPGGAFLRTEWVKLAGTSQIGVNVAGDTNRLLGDSRPLVTATGVINVVERGAWDAVVSYRTAPPGKRPDKLVLDIHPGLDHSENPPLAHVYLNDVLIKSARLDGEGDMRRVIVKLPETDLALDNRIRVEVQRNIVDGDCKRQPQPYPAQLLPTSRVEFVPMSGTPSSFFEMASLYRAGMDLAVPARFLDDPIGSLPFMARMATNLLPSPTEVVVTYVPDGQTVQARRPFLYVGEPALPGATSPVRFDKGRVVVSDPQGQMLLDISSLKNAAVAQLVMAGSHAGIWLRPMGGLSLFDGPRVRLERGNLAFLDATGVLLALDTAKDKAARVTYPDQVDWTALLEQYRLQILVGIWGLATVFFAFLLVRIYRRRAAARAAQRTKGE